MAALKKNDTLYFGVSSWWLNSEVVVNFNPTDPISAEKETAMYYLKFLGG